MATETESKIIITDSSDDNDFYNKIAILRNKIITAREFIKHQPFYYDKGKNWWLWNDKFKSWGMYDEIEILNRIYIKCRANTINAKQRGEIIQALKQVGRVNKPIELPTNIVQFKNKIVDIKTGKQIEINSSYFTVNPITWDIGTKEDTPKIDKIFKEWVGEKYVRTLYEILAYCLITDYPIQRIFCLIGAGRNGKTTFLKLLDKFIGTKNTTTASLNLLGDSNGRFESSKLYKKLVCIISETPRTIRETNTLKNLTGNEPKVRFEFKGQGGFDDRNYAKIIIATNELPKTYDTTDAWYRRWLIVDFPNKFTEERDILSEIPEIEFNNLAKKSIRILKELIDNGVFTNDGTVEDRKAKYEEKSNPLERFINLHCISQDDVSDKEIYVPFSEFYKEFIKFLKIEKLRIHSKIELSREIRNTGYIMQTKGITIGNIKTTAKCIVGLNLKEKEKE